MNYTDILYSKINGIATITINRPEVRNAFRPLTVDEMINAFQDAWDDDEIGVVILTGKGDKAFCSGGDQKIRSPKGYQSKAGNNKLKISELHTIIRMIPKPVIAAINGYAIGGGHVLHVICDLSIASENAIFGQSGPKVGSFDAGFGTAFLSQVVGEKKAREIWFLCQQYSAEEALAMGLINKIVPANELESTAISWADRILEMSPTAIRFLKASFNQSTDWAYGLQQMAHGAVHMYYETEEAQEGANAFNEKRKPNFSKFRNQTW